MEKSKLFGLFLSDLVGLSFIRFVAKRVKTLDDGAFKRRSPSPIWLKPLFFAAIATILTLVGGWYYFLVFWVLPLVTIFPVMVRWGAICEHVYGEEGIGVAESSPVVMPTLIDKLLLPNLNFSLHPYHHFYPGVSFGNLPALHRIFKAEGLTYEEMVFHGNRDYFRYILTGNRYRPPVQTSDVPGAAT
jgi:fatty acid desaturase